MQKLVYIDSRFLEDAFFRLLTTKSARSAIMIRSAAAILMP